MFRFVSDVCVKNLIILRFIFYVNDINYNIFLQLMVSISNESKLNTLQVSLYKRVDM